MVVKQNGKSRIVMSCGTIICEFVDGVADVDKDTAALLAKLGYGVEEENDTDGNAEIQSAGDNVGRGSERSSRNGKKRDNGAKISV